MEQEWFQMGSFPKQVSGTQWKHLELSPGASPLVWVGRYLGVGGSSDSLTLPSLKPQKQQGEKEEDAAADDSKGCSLLCGESEQRGTC